MHTYRLAKTPKDQYHGPLKLLPIPTRHWTDVTLDCITRLPHSNGYNAVFIIIAWLTKERHCILCIIDKNGTIVKATAYLLLNNV